MRQQDDSLVLSFQWDGKVTDWAVLILAEEVLLVGYCTHLSENAERER
jgi:hypothetical protein